MRYVEGFVVPVPAGGRAAYLASSDNMSSLLKRLGASRVVERWGSELADGVAPGASGAAAPFAGDVVLGWVEWPSREARDRASAQAKERLAALAI